MTKAQFDKAVAQGNLVLCMEYRTSKAEIITWRDKTSRATMSAPVLRHTVEGEQASYAVSERVDEKTFAVKDYVAPFKKGEKVVLKFTSATTQSGVTSFSGSLEPLTA